MRRYVQIFLPSFLAFFLSCFLVFLGTCKCVCVCACMCVHAYVCVCVCVCVCVWGGGGGIMLVKKNMPLADFDFMIELFLPWKEWWLV